MPVKVIVLVRRKQGLTPEEFRDGYENSHAALAVRLFGHLWLSYQRNYFTRTGNNFARGGPEGVEEIGFDAVSEFILRDEAAQAEMGRIAMENMAMIKEDEARWFDQAHCWTVGCETIVAQLPGG